MAESEKGVIDPELLEILVCPVGLAKVELQGDRLVCTRCGTRFRIEPGGIPNMLIEEAELPTGISRPEDLPCWGEREKRSAES